MTAALRPVAVYLSAKKDGCLASNMWRKQKSGVLWPGDRRTHRLTTLADTCTGQNREDDMDVNIHTVNVPTPLVYHNRIHT